ncbi:hypothetical protein PE067_03080 [Paracoccus sp. DMF-8]|uniref:hypothetical protein n=1 Tax=Paracoccus sp. DMF-8 TaxID=3019445 RepID=UPI0023E8245C|nr:hypothetical protein [Paracoccus sp. DMF-8]MDF3605231.1 hypothetical protein [Paracoccus sp. DMF-8]
MSQPGTRRIALAPLALRRIGVLLLALPFVMLSLLAQGTMVVRAEGPQSFMMVLCGDHDPVAMVIDDDGHVIPADEYAAPGDAPVPASDKQPCDWAVLGQPALADLGDALPLPFASARRADLVAALPAQILRAEVLTPAARGPPQA